MTVRASIFRLGILCAIAATLAVVSVVVRGPSVSAQAATISGGTWNFAAASTGNAVTIKYSGVPAAGLGASDISVAFDAAVLKITACSTGDLDGACNPNAPAGPARAAGFKAPAITTEPVAIASLTFDCIGAAGSSSALTISVNELVDGTPGSPQAISASVQNGTVVCGTAASAKPSPGAPPAYGGSLDDTSGAGTSWIILVTLALAVIAGGLAIFGARRLRSRT